MIPDFHTEEIEYNKNELQLELQDRVIPGSIIQCFSFTVLKSSPNGWTIFLTKDFPSRDMTIEGMGTRESFFIHNPYGQTNEYSVGYKTGDFLGEDDMLNLVVDYKFTFIVYPVILGGFYNEPNQTSLLPFERQWIHRSIMPTDEHTPFTPNVCITDRDLLFYIIDRLYTIDFSSPIVGPPRELEVAIPQEKILNPTLTTAQLMPLWIIELAKITAYQYVLSRGCPLISGNIPVDQEQVNLYETEVLESMKHTLADFLWEKSLDSESGESIVELIGPSFILVKVPGQDLWILYIETTGDYYHYNVSKSAPLLGKHIPQHLLAQNYLWNMFKGAQVSVFGVDHNPSISTYLEKNYLNESSFSTREVAEFLFSLWSNFGPQKIRLGPSTNISEHAFVFEPAPPSVDFIVNQTTPLGCGGPERARVVALQNILNRYLKQRSLGDYMSSDYELAYYDYIQAQTLDKSIARFCENQEYYLQRVVPSLEQELEGIVGQFNSNF